MNYITDEMPCLIFQGYQRDLRVSNRDLADIKAFILLICKLAQQEPAYYFQKWEKQYDRKKIDQALEKGQKFPNATLFLAAMPFAEARNNLKVVPISDPNTMAVAI